MSMTVAQRLAHFAHEVRFDDLPREVVHEAKRLLLDTLAAGIGGYHSEPAGLARRVVQGLGGAPQCGVIGAAWSTSAPLATFANGAAVRYLDCNDYYFGSDSGHPSCNIPAALALVQALGKSPEDLITAIVLGYEIHMRLCDAVAQPGISGRGWHTATHVQFSVAALAGRLLSDNPGVTANAIALSGSHHNTLAEAQRGAIPMMKATAEAYIAKGAVECALLAAAGLTGPLKVFEGRAGWGNALGVKVDHDALAAPLSRYRIMDACTKPYPAVAGAMAPIQAALDLRLTANKSAEIEEVLVTLPQVAAKKASRDPDKLHPTDKETADHSVHYCVAVSLLYGECGEHQFTDEVIGSPAVARLIDRIRVEEDPDLTALWPSSSGGGVHVTLRNGEQLGQRLIHPPGHPRNRATDGDLERKLVDMAGTTLSKDNARRVADFVWNLEKQPVLTRLFQALACD